MYLMGYMMISVPVKCEFGYDCAISFCFNQSLHVIAYVQSNCYLHPETRTASNTTGMNPIASLYRYHHHLLDIQDFDPFL